MDQTTIPSDDEAHEKVKEFLGDKHAEYERNVAQDNELEAERLELVKQINRCRGIIARAKKRGLGPRRDVSKVMEAYCQHKELMEKYNTVKDKRKDISDRQAALIPLEMVAWQARNFELALQKLGWTPEYFLSLETDEFEEYDPDWDPRADGYDL